MVEPLPPVRLGVAWHEEAEAGEGRPPRQAEGSDAPRIVATRRRSSPSACSARTVRENVARTAGSPAASRRRRGSSRNRLRPATRIRTRKSASLASSVSS